MLVTLPKPGDEGYDESQKLKRRRPKNGIVSLAYHAPVSHYLDRPCVYFRPKADWHRYPFVHERNVVTILVHESIHCVLMRIDENGYGSSDGFDNLFGSVSDMRTKLDFI